VCTLTAQESVAHEIPAGFDIDVAAPDGTWHPYRHGWRVLPHEADTDGMIMIRYVRRT
jgi:16S rRNA (cytosine967-C5)-methyltransferase